MQMKKINYLTNEAIDYLKVHLAHDLKGHLLDDEPTFFIKLFKENGWIKESKYEIADNIDCLSFDPDFNISDPINLRVIHESLRDLPPTVAADGRIWTGLSFTDFWSYIQYRRHDDLTDGDELAINSSYILMRGKRRSLYINCLSRLWWTAFLLYDNNNLENPYELCDFFASQSFPSRIMLLSSRNFVSNGEIAKGIVQCLFNRSKEGKTHTRKQFEEVLKYLNNIGGVSLIDALSREEIYEVSKRILANKYPN